MVFSYIFETDLDEKAYWQQTRWAQQLEYEEMVRQWEEDEGYTECDGGTL